VGTASPGSPPSVPPQICRPYVILSLHKNTFLLVGSERVAIEICEIKSEKSTIPASRQPRSIPPNAARNGHDLDWQCLIFDGALPAHRARLIGFPFREHASSPPPALAHPFASRLGATQFTGGSVLVGAYYTNIYLGYETIFESPGAVPVPSPPGGGVYQSPYHACYR